MKKKALFNHFSYYIIIIFYVSNNYTEKRKNVLKQYIFNKTPSFAQRNR